VKRSDKVTLRFAAGTLIAERPPHRSERARFRHSAKSSHRADVSSLTLLSAEQAYQQASVTLTQMKASPLGDTTALFQALGGG
jgi:hypothetical protein